jgi:hypothetical protein
MILKNPRELKSPNIDQSITQGYLYYASQGSLSINGSWCILYMLENHVTAFKPTYGDGTNNRAKIYDLWFLLKLALDRGVSNIQIMDDSNIIIDWVKGMNKLENLIIV